MEAQAQEFLDKKLVDYNVAHIAKLLNEKKQIDEKYAREIEGIKASISNTEKLTVLPNHETNNQKWLVTTSEGWTL